MNDITTYLISASLILGSRGTTERKVPARSDRCGVSVFGQVNSAGPMPGSRPTWYLTHEYVGRNQTCDLQKLQVAPLTVPLFLEGRHAGDRPVTGRLGSDTAPSLPTVDSPTGGYMAEKKNRRASVQLNVRLEPAEAALIKRVIPKGSLRAVTVSLLVEHARKLEAQMPTITEGDATAA